MADLNTGHSGDEINPPEISSAAAKNISQ